MAIIPKSNEESSHWYDSDGKAVHAVPTADGKSTRNTNITDARKLGLYPSVTGILGIFAKPELEKWKMKQVALSAFNHRRPDDEPLDRSVDSAIAKAFVQVHDAAEFGTNTHAEISDILFGRKMVESISDEMAPMMVPVIDYLNKVSRIMPWNSEEVLVNHRHGFAGTCDLSTLITPDDGLVIDFKTRKTNPRYRVEPRDLEPMQIAAYAKTKFPNVKRVWGANIYISTTEPGRNVLVAYTPEVLDFEWQVFTRACEIWRFIKRYDPREVPDPQVEKHRYGFRQLSRSNASEHVDDGVLDEIQPLKTTKTGRTKKPDKPTKEELVAAEFSALESEKRTHGKVKAWSPVLDRLIEIFGGVDNAQGVIDANITLRQFKSKLSKIRKKVEPVK